MGNELGVFLRNKRYEQNITLRQLGRFIGEPQKYISDIENGKKLPNIINRSAVLFKYSKLFNIDFSVLRKMDKGTSMHFIEEVEIMTIADIERESFRQGHAKANADTLKALSGVYSQWENRHDFQLYYGHLQDIKKIMNGLSNESL